MNLSDEPWEEILAVLQEVKLLVEAKRNKTWRPLGHLELAVKQLEDWHRREDGRTNN